MANFSQSEVLDEVGKQATAAGIDPFMAKAVVLAENTKDGSLKSRTSYSGDAVSPKGASGVMQVMPATAMGLQGAGFLPADWKHDAGNLVTQVAAGIAAMKEKMGRMNDPADPGELASVYNGSSATHRAYKVGLLDQMPAETKQYTVKLRNAMAELGAPIDPNDSQRIANAASTPGAAGAAGRTQSTTNKTTTRSNASDPATTQLMYTDAMGAVAPGGSFDQATDSVTADSQRQREADKSLTASFTAAGIAAADVAGTKAAIDAANAATRAKILSISNMNHEAVGNEMQKALDAVTSTSDKAASLRPEIDRRMAVGIFDNPLEWFVNQTRLPGMVAEYNGIVGQQATAEERYKSLASIVTTQQTLTQATQADQIAAHGRAEAKSALATAKLNSDKLESDAVGANIRNTMTLQQLTGQKIAIESKLMDMTKETTVTSEANSDKASAAKQLQIDVDRISNLQLAAGGSPMSAQEYKLLPPAQRAIYSSAASSGKFGKDFGESFMFVQDKGDLAKMAIKEGAATANWVQGTGAAVNKEARDLVAQRHLAGDKTATQAKVLPDLLNAKQEKYETESVTDMRTASKDNPMKLDYATISKDPLIANNVVANWVNMYGPAGTNKLMENVDEQLMLGSFVQAVKDGKLTPAQVGKDFSEFYKFATLKQANTTQYQIFGLSRPLNKTYPVIVSGFGAASTGLDLGNATSVENKIVGRLAADQQKANQQQSLQGLI